MLNCKFYIFLKIKDYVDVKIIFTFDASLSTHPNCVINFLFIKELSFSIIKE